MLLKHRSGNDPGYNIITYFLLVLGMIFFVVLYVWQNIEVMKLTLEYKRKIEQKKNLIKDNDRLLYEIEKYKRMEHIETYARQTGMKPLQPSDFGSIIVKEK